MTVEDLIERLKRMPQSYPVVAWNIDVVTEEAIEDVVTDVRLEGEVVRLR